MDSETGPGSRSAENDAEADRVLATALPLVTGIQATFGRICEVVLHDFRRGDHSVVAIAGDVTHRKVGSPMSAIGLSLLRQGEAAEDRLNYVTRLPDGRVMKSSTMLLRLADGTVTGALCVNLDVTQLRMSSMLLSEVIGDGGETTASEPQPVAFGSDAETVIESVLAEVEAQLGKPLAHLATAEWLSVFKTLDERGVFQLRRAVPMLAGRLGMSRASVYNHIGRLRDETPSDS
ncbi:MULTISPECIES: PAS domain-containing protein [unclassified Streptomyces]|uniref:helix-turn-helix transcriptional regulator n=1 Tax=unclassified Streptomyces TaxID=2593676 RepID=UPI00341AF018